MDDEGDGPPGLIMFFGLVLLGRTIQGRENELARGEDRGDLHLMMFELKRCVA
jgi:hypothetical protein